LDETFTLKRATARAVLLPVLSSTLLCSTSLDCRHLPCVTLDLSNLVPGDILLTACEELRSPVVPMQRLLVPLASARWAHAAIFDGLAFWDIMPDKPAGPRTLSHFTDVEEFHVRRLIDTTVSAVDLRQFLARNLGATYTSFVSAGMVGKVLSRFRKQALPPIALGTVAGPDFVCSELVMRALRACSLTDGAILSHLAFPFPCDYAYELSVKSVKIEWLPIAACNNERRN